MSEKMFTSKTAEVRSLIAAFMGQVQEEVERKDIVEYVQTHIDNGVTDGVIAGAIKMMTADGEIYPVRRGCYVKGVGKAKSTTFEKIYNVCRRFQLDLDRACTFNMLELTDAEKSIYPQVQELSEQLRDEVRTSTYALEALVEMLRERELEPNPTECEDAGIAEEQAVLPEVGLPESDADKLEIELVDGHNESSGVEESPSEPTEEQTVTGDEPFESTGEQPEPEGDSLEPSETSLESEPSSKRRGRRSKKN
jgi:hypothetical protein